MIKVFLLDFHKIVVVQPGNGSPCSDNFIKCFGMTELQQEIEQTFENVLILQYGYVIITNIN